MQTCTPCNNAAVSTTPNLRAEHKLRTRDALVAAGYDLLWADGAVALTADRIAQHAGVSRRTFFNYFPSVEAAMVAKPREALAEVTAMIERRPEGEHVIDSANAVVDELFTVQFLDDLAKTWRYVDGHADAARWLAHDIKRLTVASSQEWAQQRFPLHLSTPMQRAVAVGCLLTTFEAARRAWLATASGPVTAAGREDFVGLCAEAFTLIRPLFDSEKD